MPSCFDRVSFRGSFRSYQQEILDVSDRYLADGHLHIVAAPGSGKTVLGLELIRRLGKPTLILSPTVTVREQWGKRFEELFLPAGEPLADYVGDELGCPAPLCSITYQALHAASRPGEDGRPLWAAAIAQMGVGTVCLDEAHHLRSEWQRSLEALLQELAGTVSVIALTATPPYDSSPAEWERYMRVCGPIDAEIFVPELVKRGTLCPHQDYLHFSYPTAEESELLSRYAAHADAALDALHASGLIRRAAALAEAEALEEEALFENADAFVDLLSLARALGEEVSDTAVRRLLPSGLLPRCDESRAEHALSFVFSQSAIFGEELAGSVRTILAREGLIEGGVLSLRADGSLRRRMLSSLGKLESIAQIARAEIGACGRGLRMLILTDHIRENLLGLVNSSQSINAMGAVPIFEAVRRVCPYDTHLALLTGSLVIVPNSILGELLYLADTLHCSCQFTPLGDSWYATLQTAGGSKESVALLTEALERGLIHILVGTKALLGEGWDSPCVNTLVLASFVGSFMSSNQMRGRAIRVDKTDENKAANIWHLVTLLPPEQKLAFLYGDEERPLGEDYALMERRFACFLAPSYDGERIESGLARLELPAPPYTRERVNELNAQMLARASDRRAMAQSWQKALMTEPSGRVREAVRAAPSVRPRVYARRSMDGAALNGALLTAMGAACVFAPPAAFFVLIPLMGYSAWSMVGDLRRGLNGSSALKSTQSMGQALLRTLRACGLIESEEAAVLVQSRAEGVECSLSGASAREKTLFAEAMGELLSPIENPRYLLIRQSRLLGLTRSLEAESYACPTVLGAKKEYAERLRQELEKRGDRFRLVYTRSTEGHRTLLACRRAANESRREAKVRRARTLGEEK